MEGIYFQELQGYVGGADQFIGLVAFFLLLITLAEVKEGSQKAIYWWWGGILLAWIITN